MKPLFIIALALLVITSANAQIDVGGMVKNKVNQRVEQKTNQAIDKTLDETEEGVKDAAKGDKKKGKEKGKKEGDTEGGSDNNNQDASKDKNAAVVKPTLTTYSKFDFVPGEKIIVEDNFSQVAIGDFPVEWNTNSGGEVVTIEGQAGHWLMIKKEGVFIPDYITDLPENFTLQYDVMCNENFDYYSGWLSTTFVSTANREKLNDFGTFSNPALGMRLGIHPKDAGGSQGACAITTWDKDGAELIHNEVPTMQFHGRSRNLVHVSIWRQKQRMRLYLNEEKVLDIPRAFDASAKYNAMVIGEGAMNQEDDRYLISNMKLAIGAPDTRSKLITEGKFVTHGILFDSGSDQIKPESYGALKDIASVLAENTTVKVRIIGHTDSDGDDSSNLELSKKRAAAVKESLSKNFAIDAARMETDGKGESQPTEKNDSATGKANNRRVEFVKL